MKDLLSAILATATVSELKNLDVIQRAQIILSCAAVLCVTYVILQSIGVFPLTWWPN
ncbi:MAG TPA: hypothetical protein VGH50_03570 [Candidatus Binatia bacterium]|jgi:hypothetical protein